MAEGELSRGEVGPKGEVGPRVSEAEGDRGRKNIRMQYHSANCLSRAKDEVRRL